MTTEQFWEHIDALREKAVSNISVDDLSLTKEEKQVLDKAPKDFVRKVYANMNRYTPLKTKYNYRDKVVLKGIAQLLLLIPTIKEAYNSGLEQADSIINAP